jgi:hypothetical protein
MIKVEMYLNDAQEAQWFAQCSGIVEQYRTQKGKPPVVSGTPPAPPVDNAHVEPGAEQFDAKVIATITPEGVTKPKLTAADMEKAVIAYKNAHGTPATRAVLDSVAPGKRMGEIDEALWPELFAKLKVEA